MQARGAASLNTASKKPLMVVNVFSNSQLGLLFRFRTGNGPWSSQNAHRGARQLSEPRPIELMGSVIDSSKGLGSYNQQAYAWFRGHVR